MSRDSSVLVISYSRDRVDDCIACIDGIRSQAYDGEAEVVAVTDAAERADARPSVYESVTAEYADADDVRVVPDRQRLSLAEARNKAADVATGDVYVFIDDDAVPSTGWLAALMEPYEEGEIAVGGPAHAAWGTRRPRYLPDEMLWLVGVTHAGFAPTESNYVRNTFGCNISFDADAFDAVGGFDPQFGKDHGKNLQGEETDLCWRLYEEFGQQVRYVPEASVEHKIYGSQTSFTELTNRAFWQGYTKALLSGDDARDTEQQFLRHLLMNAVPKQLLRGDIGHAMGNLAFTGCVGFGYLTGRLH